MENLQARIETAINRELAYYRKNGFWAHKSNADLLFAIQAQLREYATDIERLSGEIDRLKNRQQRKIKISLKLKDTIGLK
jgi:hypothetical protein